MKQIANLKLKFGLLGLCLFLLAFIPRADDPIAGLVNVLQRWTDSIPQEKVYLQTNKSYYNLGDTIWFKGYITAGSRHKLTTLSGALYVDLINEKDSVLRSLKLPITAGMAFGNFVLGDDYKQGAYRIRSYTQWMRNAGNEYFYDNDFTVVDPTSNNSPSVKTNLAQSDVQFFPEGGELVNGINSHIAFKAIGVDGLGIDIKGKIVDNENNEITDINTLHAGMGSFMLRPQTGKTYAAPITFPDGTNKTIALPAAKDDGLTLAVYQPTKDSILVRINASKSALQSSVGFIAHTNGETVFASTIKLTNPTTSIWLEKKAFPTGIAQFMVFNSSGEPLNERIAFIRSNDLLNLDLKTVKTTYSSKEHIKIDLTANDGKGKPAAGNFSVAVIDESKVPVDENSESTIFSNLLLTSDLKGYVEKPNYYFNKPNEETDKALDNLMLTQGYRRFEWKALNKLAKPVYPVEAQNTVFTGTVNKMNNKPLPGGSVTLVSSKPDMNQNITTDDYGRFKFSSIYLTDSIRFTIQAKDGNRSSVKLILDTVPSLKTNSNLNTNAEINSSIKAYLETPKNQGNAGQSNKIAHSKQTQNINASATIPQVNTENTVTINPKGYNKVREFYAPRYDRAGNANTQPDARTTVYWNPNVKTDGTGRSSFDYFNADGPGTYRVVVEGINTDGQIGRQVFRYTVGGSMNSTLAASGGNSATRNTLSAMSTASADKNLSLITAPLDSLNKRLPVEKVYLHMDKPYYNIGDTLWFKSYLLDRVSLSDSHVSNLLYVELVNDSTDVVRRISIPVKDGLGWAQIPLPGSIFREGGYTLRAYTNWMQNFGEDYVFSQRFYLGVPTNDVWLVKSASVINHVDDKDQLQVDIKLTRADKFYTAVTGKKIKVKLYEGKYFIAEQTLTTGPDGGLKFTERLKAKKDGRIIRAQLMSLDPADRGKIVQVPLTIRRSQNIDLQFLPEGGNLVAGLSTVVGFKAIAEDGKSAEIAGTVSDSKGNKVASFSSIHNGMGSFDFVPKAGETYTAKLEQPKDASKTYTLPIVKAVGTVMHVDNKDNNDDILVSLKGLNSLPTDSACYLIGTSRGLIYFSKKVETNQPNITVPKKLFPTGIARLTLFKGKRPLNERAVFIDQHDELAINITPDKNAYANRDSVNLAIEVKDKNGKPVQGSFSLAVTDDSQVKYDSLNNNGMLASLLLNSELRGYIESPGYYINRKDKQAWQALDNLLLTQGWRGYDWKEVFAPVKPLSFEAEKEFKVTGKVTDLLKKPVPHAPVVMSSKKPEFVRTTTTDAYGIYTFKNLPVIDSGVLYVEASNSEGKKLTFGNVAIDRFQAPIPPLTLRDPVMPWYVNTDSTQLNYVKRKTEKSNWDDFKLTGNVLKQVDIKGKKIIPGVYTLLPDGTNYVAYTRELVKQSAVTNLYDLIQQKLPGARVVDKHDLPAFMVRDQMLDVYIDNIPLPVEIYASPTVDELIQEISSFPITQFKAMSISVSPPSNNNPTSSWVSTLQEGRLRSEGSLQYLYDRARVTPGLPVSYINIFTEAGKGWYRKDKPDAAIYRPLPVMYPDQFYSPKYTVNDPAVTGPDYRSTLYWQPNIFTDQNGKAKVMFYTSDAKDKFTVKVSGVDVAGGIGDNVIKLKMLKDEIK